jgi:hypothetical protein
MAVILRRSRRVAGAPGEQNVPSLDRTSVSVPFASPIVSMNVIAEHEVPSPDDGVPENETIASASSTAPTRRPISDRRAALDLRVTGARANRFATCGTTFIVSRIKEMVDGGTPTEEAVERGIVTTAGTVTSAAIVMVAVFAIFASLSQIDIKQMGFGLAVAILIDATIVRAVLLPATMKLLGKWNWYLPSWLEWVPNLSAEPRVSDEGEALEARPALTS